MVPPVTAVPLILPTDRQCSHYIFLYCIALWCCQNDSRVIARVHPVHVINAEQRQMAANLCTKPRT